MDKSLICSHILLSDIDEDCHEQKKDNIVILSITKMVVRRGNRIRNKGATGGRKE